MRTLAIARIPYWVVWVESPTCIGPMPSKLAGWLFLERGGQSTWERVFKHVYDGFSMQAAFKAVECVLLQVSTAVNA